MSILYREPSIDASYQVSVHLGKQFQRRRFFRNQPIRNKHCLWWPCLLMDRDEMSNCNRGLSIDASYQVSVRLTKRFQRRRTTAVRKIMSEIDPDHKPEDVIRSHWVGKSSGPQVSHRKPRQIIVRLSDPSVKIRLMKCRKNLKSSRDLKSVFINEDLTHTRNKIFFLARQLQKNKSIEQVWTTNGNIRLKDRHGRIYETNTIDRFLQVAVQLDPSYTLPE